MLKYPIDYFMIVVVGFAIGFGTMFVVRPLTPSTEIPTFSELQEKIAAGEIDPEPEPAQRGSVRATYTWLEDTSQFYDEIEYLMEANCSDHAMREYGRFLSSLDTGGFDPETGRLIGAGGHPINYFTMRKLVNGLLPLQPLAYMKDEFVPDNFKPVMQNVSRKKDWTTCKFNMPMAALRSLPMK
ncbi:hypothetical protein [Roseibium sp.]|uniref:hypothetical protein n=1 Tax=Roseibium sp. TaxID=1936156 RepID=UPI003A981421